MKPAAVTRLLCLLLCLILLAGCGENAVSSAESGSTTEFGSIPETDSDTTTVQAAVSGSFSMPINVSYGWDPYNCISMENQAVMDLIYEGLFTMNTQFDAEPVLCSEYTVSDDGLQYTLTIRDAVFSDGDTVTADDVYYSMTKAEDSELYGNRFRDVSYYEVTGPKTITIYMANPNDRLPCMMDFPIVPNFSNAANALGTGPFVRNGTTNLTKNTHWWQGPENVSFDTVSLYASASAEDTRDNFEIDTIHLVYNNPLATSAATYHCDYELWNSSGTVMQYLGFNMAEGILQDAQVRSAILKAIDRTAIAESVYHNYADAAALPVAPSSSMYDEDLARNYAYDRDTALSELMSSGSFYLPDDHPVVTGEIYDEDFDLAAYTAALLGELEPETDAEDPAEEDAEIPQEEPAAEDSEITEDAQPVYANMTAYNRITLLVMSGSLYRSEAAQQVADDLTKVGFTVTVKELDRDEFIYTLNNQPEDWDIYCADVNLTPDFDLRSILYPGNKLYYGSIPEDATLRSIYYSALENSGNRYDLYEYIMDNAYICPILFQNNAVFTARGIFTGLNPAPGNLFYGVTNITVNN